MDSFPKQRGRPKLSRHDIFGLSLNLLDPAGTELLIDVAKLYKAALGNCFEIEEWGPIVWCVMSDHFACQGKSPFEYHARRKMGAYGRMYSSRKMDSSLGCKWMTRAVDR
ncbi:hypothetical protein ACET3Z_031244 [Daucus carota]